MEKSSLECDICGFKLAIKREQGSSIGWAYLNFMCDNGRTFSEVSLDICAECGFKLYTKIQEGRLFTEK